MKSFPYDKQRSVHAITRYSLPTYGKHSHSLDPATALIMHLDVDAFYAQVEQDDYDLRGTPVVVGAWHDTDARARGIIATASYEARSFGVATGLSYFEALKLCPYLIAFRINYTKYRAISKAIEGFLKTKTPTLERYSMDEFFGDFGHLRGKSETELHYYFKNLQREVFTTFGLHCSIGIAHTKSTAKIASGLQKPRGISLLIKNSDTWNRIALSKVAGIGKSRTARLTSSGILTIGDASKKPMGFFQKIFGPQLGTSIWSAATGVDQSPVDPETYAPKEIHHIHTFTNPTTSDASLKAELQAAVETVAYRMRAHGLRTHTWELYLRFHSPDWEGVPIAFSTSNVTFCDSEIFSAAWKKLQPVTRLFCSLGQRFLGLGLCALKPTESRQLTFDNQDTEALYLAKDQIEASFEQAVIRTANTLQHNPRRTHFLCD